MNIEKQVTSLELSQKLKELGVPQESLFYYGYPCCEEDSNIDIYYTHEEGMATQDCSAFIAGELMNMLPLEYQIYQRFDNTYWCISLSDEDCECCGEDLTQNMEETTSKTMQDALAKAIIHLIENKLINVKHL